MRTIEVLMITLAMTVATCFAVSYTWDDLPPQCSLEDSTNGDFYLICVPDDWNYDVIVYDHGYALPSSPEPTEVPYMPVQIFVNPVDGAYLWDTIMSMGYALIATSYRGFSFDIEDAYDDTLALIQWFDAQYSDMDDIIVLGNGFGGVIATKFCNEEAPILVSGCIAMSSPLGSMQGLFNHLADTRTVLDYFYPELELPGSPVEVPDSLYEDWFSENSEFKDMIKEALLSDSETMEEIYSILGLYYDADNENVLNMFLSPFGLYVSIGTEVPRMWDCVPYTNMHTHYTGSADDRCFNKLVERFDTDCPEGTIYEGSFNYVRPVFVAAGTRNPVIPNSDTFELLQEVIDVDDPAATNALNLILTTKEGHNMVSSNFIQTVILEMEAAAELC